MKTYLILILLFFCCTETLLAQAKDQSLADTKIKLYKKKKKTANTLLIAGGSGILLGNLLGTIPTDNAMTGTGALLGGMVLVTAGTVTSLVSIPFYIDAYYEKKKIVQLQPIVS